VNDAPPAAAGGWRDRVALLAAGGFVLLAMTLPTSIAPMGIGVALCAVPTLALFALRPRPRWPATPVDRPALAWIVALVIVSVFAQEPARSFPAVKKGLLPALVGLAAFHGADARQGRRAVRAFLAMAGLAALVGFGIWWSHGHSMASRARGLVGHYMTFGGQLGLELPVALAFACFAESRRDRVLGGAVTLLTAAALAATFTRSSWLGAVASTTLVLAVAWPLGVGVLAALGALAVAFAPGDWGARLRDMFGGQHDYTAQRPLMWKAGLHMFRDHPWTGVGMQDLREIYWRYREPGAYERVGHLHNSYVQVAATMGVVGLAAFAWLLSGIARAASPAIAWGRGFRSRVRAGGDGAALRLGVTAALVGMLVTGCAEWNFGDEELLYTLYVLAGIAWASRGWAAPEAARR
jgi:O-antigen ligase